LRRRTKKTRKPKTKKQKQEKAGIATENPVAVRAWMPWRTGRSRGETARRLEDHGGLGMALRLSGA
jgi:hypothetical protein